MFCYFIVINSFLWNRLLSRFIVLHFEYIYCKNVTREKKETLIRQTKWKSVYFSMKTIFFVSVYSITALYLLQLYTPRQIIRTFQHRCTGLVLIEMDETEDGKSLFSRQLSQPFDIIIRTGKIYIQISKIKINFKKIV